MEKVGIVILNYLNYKDTIECIESIENQSCSEYKVIIVDNHSKNESFTVISEYIKDKDKFHIIQSSKNLGFAKGNNIGIRYLMDKFSINNILICNNDVIFNNENYLKNLMEIEINSKIGAVGTSIIGSDNKNQNPSKFQHSKLIMERIVDKSENPSYFRKIKNYILKTNSGRLLQKLKAKAYGKNHNKIETIDKSSRILENDEFLHGSVILLTENYLSIFKGFYPRTFLYGEEIILDILLKKVNLKMLFIPSLSIIHKEDQSSAMSFNNDSSIMNNFQYESNKVILTLYDKDITAIKQDFIEYQ